MEQGWMKRNDRGDTQDCHYNTGMTKYIVNNSRHSGAPWRKRMAKQIVKETSSTQRSGRNWEGWERFKSCGISGPQKPWVAPWLADVTADRSVLADNSRAGWKKAFCWLCLGMTQNLFSLSFFCFSAFCFSLNHIAAQYQNGSCSALGLKFDST